MTPTSQLVYLPSSGHFTDQSKAFEAFEERKRLSDPVISIVSEEIYHDVTFKSGLQLAFAKRIFSSFEKCDNPLAICALYSNGTPQVIYYEGPLGNQIITKFLLNPNRYFPLTALVTVYAPFPVKVSLIIKGKDEDSLDIVKNMTGLNISHYLPVVGLYEYHRNEVQIRVFNSADEAIYNESMFMTTEKVNFRREILKPYAFDGPDSLRYLGIMGNRFIVDIQGYVRWYHTMALDSKFKLMYAISDSEFIFCPLKTRIERYDYMGNLIVGYDFPSSLNHEIIEKTPGGNILVLSSQTPDELTMDVILEINRDTGAVLRKWDLREYFDPSRPAREIDKTSFSESDWLHANRVVYDPKDDTIFISSRNQCFFSKIGYTDDKIKYIAGIHDNWQQRFQKYLLRPINFNTSRHPNQDWSFFQHQPVIKKNGNILVYDNGGARPGWEMKNYNSSKDLWNTLKIKYPLSNYADDRGPPPGYVRVVEYKVDYENMTITKIMEYTDFPHLASFFVGGSTFIDEEENFIMITYGEMRTVSVVDLKQRKCLFMVKVLSVRYLYRSYRVDLRNLK